MLAMSPLRLGFLDPAGLSNSAWYTGSLGASVVFSSDQSPEKITFDQTLMIRKRTPKVAALLGAARAMAGTVNPVYPEKQVDLFSFLKSCLWLSDEILAKVEDACSRITYSSPPATDVFLSLCPNEVPGLSLTVHMRPDGEADLVITPHPYLPDGSGLDAETGAPDAAMLRARLSCLAAGRFGKLPRVGVHVIDFSSLLPEFLSGGRVVRQNDTPARVAAALSVAIQQNTRFSDFIGRAGARQFCVIQAETESETALLALRRRLEARLPVACQWAPAAQEAEFCPISITSYLFADLPPSVRNTLCAPEDAPEDKTIALDTLTNNGIAR